MNDYIMVDEEGNVIELPPEDLYLMKLSFLRRNLKDPYMIKTCMICEKEFVTIIDEPQPVCSSVECNYGYFKKFVE